MKLLRSLIVFVLVAGSVPLPTQAAASYTYTFTPATATQYTFDPSALTFTDNNAAALTSPEENWYHDDWLHRQKLVIDRNRVSGNLRDFPVAVVIDDKNNHLFGNARSDGGDILFTLGDGITKLPHEIEEYKDADSQHSLVAWVKLPTLTSEQDTTFYLYYGNAAAADQQNIADVWDENFALVQHLNEAPANGVAGHMNATRNNNDGTPTNFGGHGSTTDERGRLGGADRFQGPAFAVGGGARTYVNVPDASSLDVTKAVTMSAWIKGESQNECCRKFITKGYEWNEGYQLQVHNPRRG